MRSRNGAVRVYIFHHNTLDFDDFIAVKVAGNDWLKLCRSLAAAIGDIYSNEKLAGRSIELQTDPPDEYKKDKAHNSALNEEEKKELAGLLISVTLK